MHAHTHACMHTHMHTHTHTHPYTSESHACMHTHTQTHTHTHTHNTTTQHNTTQYNSTTQHNTTQHTGSRTELDREQTVKTHTQCHAEELTRDTQETNSQNRPHRNAFPVLLSLKTLLQHTLRHTSWNCIHAVLPGTHHGTVSMPPHGTIHAVLPGTPHGTVSMLSARYSLFLQNGFCYVTD